MMNKRKGTPCGCDSDPCGCSPKSQCVKTINGQYPDANHEFGINAGEGVTVTPDGNGIRIGISLASPMVFRGTVGTGGTIATLPQANSDNLGWTYVAISSGTTPDTPPKSYDIGDMLISNGVEWSVVPSGDDPVDWSQIENKPTTVAGYGITDAVDISSVQDITANKTIKSIAPALITTKTNVSRSYVGFTGVGNITMNANDGQIAGINPYRSTPGGNSATLLDVVCHNASGTAKQIEIVNQDDGNAYVTAPSRSYNSANVNDIVTIGSLASNPNVVHTTGNETINGTKSFGNTIKITPSTYTAMNSLFAETSGTSHQAVMQATDTTTGNTAGIYIRIKDDGTAQLMGVKIVNGTPTVKDFGSW